MLKETYCREFWCFAGGAMEEGESVEQAALRELWEETGLLDSDVTLGPVVWYGEFMTKFSSTPMLQKERFVVVRTRKSDVHMNNMCESEVLYMKELRWFSLEEIQNSTEKIYPTSLKQHLPAIIKGDYPNQPMLIQLED
jgi:8-oxo-dGTP pyrophosphatase MutT (NUDIX family)